ncbi:MAG: DNA primase [Saprospiraceae bacterium]|jgi:DNA primase
MLGRIPQSFIDDVLDRLDIIDVIGSRIDLRKSGKNYSACCPFHDEKTPSFSVSPDKQFYYCFGCGVGGNAIGFVIDFDRISFPETLEGLAQQVGLEVPHEVSDADASINLKKPLYALMQDADSFYRSNLRDPANAKKAVEYLKSRQLSGETARNFGIGFAPPGWDNLLKGLGVTEEKIQQLKDIGLLIDRQDENKLYDRFRDRIIFPIRDVRGRTLGFGGRVLGDDKPKYLNSPETPLFHKGRELYGLYEANRHLRDIKNLIVVEGYMDVAVLAQNGIHNAVATLGTAATAEHLNKLFRYTSEVIFCFDGDKAGQKAASRALETSLPAMLDGRSAKFMFLPDGEDPDSLVLKIGSTKFNELAKNAMPLSDFLFESLSKDYDCDSLDGRARLSKLATPLINKMPLGVFKTLMIQTLSQRTGIEVSALTKLIEPSIDVSQASYKREDQPDVDTYNYPEYDEQISEKNYLDHSQLRRKKTSNSERVPINNKHIKIPAINTLIALLANHPELEKCLPATKELEKLKIEGLDILMPLTKVIRENPDYTLNNIIGYWRSIHDPSQAEHLAQIAAIDLFRTPTNTSRNNEKEFVEIFIRLNRDLLADIEPMDLFHHLIKKEKIDDHDLKSLNRAWLNLPKEQKNDEMKVLFTQIASKPRIP